jgi:hypothetical protein
VNETGGTTSILVARPVGAPAFIYGATTAWMRFPANVLPSAQYTLFFVARYNGNTRGRIFQGLRTNWLSGFSSGQSGVTYHGSCLWTTHPVDLHGYEWVIGSDRSNSFRSNGVDRTNTTAKACDTFDQLAINTGLAPQPSDFAVQHMLVYDRRLSDAEVIRIEAWLTSLQPAFTPANMQVDTQLHLFNHFKTHCHISNATAAPIRSSTIVYRVSPASMTHEISLPAALRAPGPLVRVSSALSVALQTLVVTAGS